MLVSPIFENFPLAWFRGDCEVLEAARDEIAAQEYQAHKTVPAELEQDTR